MVTIVYGLSCGRIAARESLLRQHCLLPCLPCLLLPPGLARGVVGLKSRLGGISNFVLKGDVAGIPPGRGNWSAADMRWFCRQSHTEGVTNPGRLVPAVVNQMVGQFQSEAL